MDALAEVLRARVPVDDHAAEAGVVLDDAHQVLGVAREDHFEAAAFERVVEVVDRGVLVVGPGFNQLDDDVHCCSPERSFVFRMRDAGHQSSAEARVGCWPTRLA